MKGYAVSSGYMGYIGNGHYMLFATEQDYEDWLEENEDNYNEIDLAREVAFAEVMD